jgi:hypothetical protein
MEPNTSVIVYRSQSEANIDWFMNNMVFPWMYDHWLAILIVMGLGIMLYVFFGNGRRRGYRRPTQPWD